MQLKPPFFLVEEVYFGAVSEEKGIALTMFDFQASEILVKLMKEALNTDW